MPASRRLLAPIVTAALLTISVPALSPAANADPSHEKFEARLAYTKGAPPERIYMQLRIAARRACESNHVAPLKHTILVKECAQGLLDAAIARLNRPELAALHSASRG